MDVIAADSLPADVKECDFSVEGGERFRFESLVIDLAAGFINVDPEDVDHAIENCLRRIVEALGLDRSTLFQRSGDGGEANRGDRRAQPRAAAAIPVARQRPRAAERRRTGRDPERRAGAADRDPGAPGNGRCGESAAGGRRAFPHRAGPRANPMAGTRAERCCDSPRASADDARDAHGEARYPAPRLIPRDPVAPPAFRREAGGVDETVPGAVAEERA